jgi:hypothetical protein
VCHFFQGTFATPLNILGGKYQVKQLQNYPCIIPPNRWTQTSQADEDSH